MPNDPRTKSLPSSADTSKRLSTSSSRLSLAKLPELLAKPNSSLQLLAEDPHDARAVFLRCALWLGLLPPVFAGIGTTLFGWRLGVVEPLFFSHLQTLGISVLYFLTLLFGFISTAVVGRWMAPTYAASESLGAYFSLLTVVGAPLTIGSVMHLYPHVLLNLLVLVPCLIWSMFLLYRGVPVVLKTSPERGMLMASSIIGYLFVAFVSLIGISVFLWTRGIGPRLGV